MTTKDCITPEYLKECFDYDPETGIVLWKARPRHHFNNKLGFRVSNSKFAGTRAGSKFTSISCNKSYYQCCFRVKGKQVCFSLHRIIWVLVYGEFPNNIDHINGDGMDNSLCNLRSVTRTENQRNMRLLSNNTSGVCGVWWDKRVRLWMAGIKLNSKKIHLGYFKHFNDAVIARKMAEIKYGFHENHGTIRPL